MEKAASKKKKEFIPPKIELIIFETKDDIMTASGLPPFEDNENEELENTDKNGWT